jgi:hypothetical protein
MLQKIIPLGKYIFQKPKLLPKRLDTLHEETALWRSHANTDPCGLGRAHGRRDRKW